MPTAVIFIILVHLLLRSGETAKPGSGNNTNKLVEYFCSRSGPTEIPEQTEGKIITLFKGNSFYENNQFCQWNLNAGSGNRIQIEVDQWKLQYAPPRALCDSYDHIKVADDDGFLVSWCQILPIFKSPFNINSRGQNLTISFQSDQTTPRNQRYSGGRLSFRIFDASDCPPNWISHKDTCFTLKHITQTWSDGQKTCNFEQSNLASIESQEEFDFLKTSYKGVFSKVWFGLNDKSIFGNFKWIDNSSAAGAFKAMSSLKADPFNHCGLIDFKKSTVKMADCENDASVLCRTAKGKVSKIYPIPLFKTDKGNEKDSKTSRGLLLGVLIPCILLLLLIVLTVTLYRHREKFSCFRSQTTAKRSQELNQQEELSLAQPSAPACCDEPYHPYNAPGHYISPPTYEEALESNAV
ncbi:hypothetical protein RRG08_064753 [Elysia crispata]|uniref:Uncharacterized protein n=1 Tax=Elysia crispata TaxID=231223 RepID=A0AAE0YZQ3_9GAST|nr:hypothetical protein RRG08_064753 [Elysia crispata]